MPGKTIGPFEIGERLGAGGMGVVYRATYSENGKQVALKLLPASLNEDTQLVARFKRELEILKKLKHPNIVLCFGGGRLGDQRFYAMEIVEGGTLADVLKSKGRFSWEDVVDYGIQVCEALQHAHEHGIVHRDLKPANLMLDKKGNVKLTDFGLARVTDATALTAAGKTLGTFAYMAPEQITGKSPITPKTDLYALGCVFYELLTGKPPFASDSAAELFYQHLKKKPERICTQALDCPVWLEGLVLQLLQKDPDNRPRDALAVSQSLQELKERVAQNTGMLQHSIAGEPSTLNSMADVTQVGNLLKRKKRKRSKKDLPFWEKTWVLATGLTLIVALVVWSFLPLSEETLFQRAAVLMESEDPALLRKAQDDYLSLMIQRFPEGKHAEKVREWNDKVDIVRTESKITAYKKNGGDLKSEAARIYMEGSRYEDFGDRVSALEKYKSMVQLFEDKDPEDRPYVLLARRQIAAIESNNDKSLDRIKVIKEVLDQADRDYAEGKVIQANKTWESVWLLYGDKREFDALTKRARRRMSGKFVDDDPPPAETPPKDSPSALPDEPPLSPEGSNETSAEQSPDANPEETTPQPTVDVLSIEEEARKKARGEDLPDEE